MNEAARQRRLRLSLISGSGFLLFVGVLAFLNLLGEGFFLRFDLTADRRYSLSPATRELLASLEDPLRIRFYITPDLPQPYESQGRYVEELLQEYRSAGKGKVSVEVRPVDPEKMFVEIRRLNLTAARITQMDADQYQAREAYMGMAILYQDKQAVIPLVRNTLHLEYEISSRVRVMTQKTRKNLFFISNHNEVNPEYIKAGPAGRLFDEFHVEPTRLTTQEQGLKPDVVYILGPQSQLKTEELDVLDAFLSSGVPVVVALNRRVPRPQSFRTIAQVTGLEKWMEHYGVRVERDFVMDLQSQNVAMQSAQGPFMSKYLAFPLATDLSRTNPATQVLDVLGFAYSHPLTSLAQGGLTFSPLARSSPNSWIWPGLHDVDPASIFSQLKSDPPAKFKDSGKGDQFGPFTLAAVVKGSTTSFRTGRPADITLVVAGSSYFANPQVPNPDGNALFILTMAQWLAGDGTYLSIPPKDAPFRPLRPLSPTGRTVVKVVGYVMIPFLIALGGFFHWQYRRLIQEKILAARARETTDA